MTAQDSPRRALVTGAGARLGQAIAIELGAAGFEVAIHYRSSAAGAEETLRAVQAAGGRGWLCAGDLTDPEARAAICAAVEERWDGLELLVHNASSFYADPIEEVSPEGLREMFQVHCEAPFFITQRLLPLLRAARSLPASPSAAERALIVSICDVAAERPIKGYLPYTSSKAALLALTRGWAVELAPTVRALALSPALNTWPEDFPEGEKEYLLGRVPQGRVGVPVELARLVRFVATEGSYLNGVQIPLDGGFTLSY
ncbi:MAG: SDR family oxidoreductase [Myxococcota bacterium]|nr:SDR family oxidoreductase [Myxococcota bacterium]